MGQYYSPQIFKSNKPMSEETLLASFYCHEYGQGLKLTEHSFFTNPVVEAVIACVCSFGKARVAWVGDYSDDITRKKETYSLYHHNHERLNIHPYQAPKMPKGLVWMINQTKKECVNLETYPKYFKATRYSLGENNCLVEKKEISNMLHPLPLLTCMGNGRGGGDYYDKYWGTETADYVGRWAGDIITFSDKEPNDNYTEIEPRFCDCESDLIDVLINMAKRDIKFSQNKKFN